MEHRQLERISLPRAILIRSGTLGFADSEAVLRDISAVGAYCFTLLPLTKGDVVELFLTVSDSIGSISHFAFTGTVLRIEKGITDNSLGIAVHFSAFNELDASMAAA